FVSWAPAVPALRQLSRDRSLMMGSPYRLVAVALLVAGAAGCSHPSIDGAMQPPGGSAGGSVTVRADGGTAADVPRDTGPSRGPTPPMPGIRFPFPQNRMSAG